ncbi:hypothetical protein LXA43DRAFT_1068338, partial [Ganoderma leucocontextum]
CWDDNVNSDPSGLAFHTAIQQLLEVEQEHLDNIDNVFPKPETEKDILAENILAYMNRWVFVNPRGNVKMLVREQRTQEEDATASTAPTFRQRMIEGRRARLLLVQDRHTRRRSRQNSQASDLDRGTTPGLVGEAGPSSGGGSG